MQTGATAFGPIETMIDKFGFEDLFYTPGQFANKEDYNKYRDYSQQEFLVKDELSFDDLFDFEIVCPSNSDKELLISLIGIENKDVFSKIKVDSAYYNNENPRISVDKTKTELFIRSSFNGEGYLNLYPSKVIDSTNIENGDVEKNLGNKIIFKSYLSLNNYIGNFKLTFTDESNREWFIYQRNKNKNCLNSFDESDKKPNQFPQSIKSLVTELPEYKPIYETKVRHYKLVDHTNLVLNQFDKYFINSFDEIYCNLFKFFLIIHDIGKPKAFKKGDKNKQYVYSVEIVMTIWEKLSYSQEDLSIVLVLLEGDPIGEYFQNKLSSNSIVNLILSRSNKLDLEPSKLFRFFIIYYQCDIAAYTADVGGLKFLEHLFEYKNGEKVFNEEEGLIRFSPEYWKMYLELKKEIELCQ
jgi:hypothetical protein